MSPAEPLQSFGRGGGWSGTVWLSELRDQHICFCWRALRCQRHFFAAQSAKKAALLLAVICCCSPGLAAADGEAAPKATDPKSHLPPANATPDPQVEAAVRAYLDVWRDYIARRDVVWQREQATPYVANRRQEVATGEVRDFAGKPVPDAEVTIEKDLRGGLLGRGSTDEKGRFRIEFATEIHGALSLYVTKAGYEQLAYGMSAGELVDYPLRLDPAIDANFFATLASEPDRARRLFLLLAFIGNRSGRNPDPLQVFPYLSPLRADLWAIANSQLLSERKEREAEWVQSQTVSWLIFNCDPADGATTFLDVWSRSGRLFRFDVPASGDTIDLALRAYADVRFKEEGSRTAHSFTKPVFSADGTRALAEFRVRYRHWGFTEFVVLAKVDGRWVVKVVSEGTHYDYTELPSR